MYGLAEHHIALPPAWLRGSNLLAKLKRSFCLCVIWPLPAIMTAPWRGPGPVADSTIAALKNLLASGRKLILVTGRELEDLLRVFPRSDLFEWVVAENGCLLYRPATQEQLPLHEPHQANSSRLCRRAACR